MAAIRQAAGTPYARWTNWRREKIQNKTIGVVKKIQNLRIGAVKKLKNIRILKNYFQTKLMSSG